MKGKRFQLFAKKINNNESQISTAFIHFCMLKNKWDEMLWISNRSGAYFHGWFLTWWVNQENVDVNL